MAVKHPLRRTGGLPVGKMALAVLLLFGASLMAMAVTGYLVYTSYANSLVPPEQALVSWGIGPSEVYDRNGTLLYQGVGNGDGLRYPVALDQISPYLIAATIATEDASFYSNPGVNFKGIGRALMENFTPFGPGLFQGSGGSSITQQLVKNVYVAEDQRFERQIDRKVRETVLALELKRQYEDDQILEWYLNQIFYGNMAYGAQAAAERYFSKDAKDLTLAEAAMLAGIPRSPANYTPTISGNEANAVQRQNTVLDLMKKHLEEIQGIVPLTPEQIDAARQEQITYKTLDVPIQAPHFVFYAEDQVRKLCEAGAFQPPTGSNCASVSANGRLQITTTLDLRLQHVAEDVVEQAVSANEDRYRGHNGSVVIMQPKTGEILTMVGSRDYFNGDINGEVNIATSERSMGSTNKMFTYLTAFERGKTPSSMVDDSALKLATGPVKNWNDKYMGKISIRTAFSQSVNTTAVRTAIEVGPESVADTAHRLGVSSPMDNDCGPTITLGSCEAKLLDMVFAYSTIANNGNMVGMPSVENLPEGYRKLDPISILSIKDSNGNVLYQSKAASDQVVRPAYAYMVNDILSRNAITWSSLTVGRPAATKTGTSENFKDNIVIGFTPELVIGAWVGNSDGTPMADGAFSASGVGPIWKTLAPKAFDLLKVPATQFVRPTDVVTANCGGTSEVFAAGGVSCAQGSTRVEAVAPPVQQTPAPQQVTPGNNGNGNGNGSGNSGNGNGGNGNGGD